MGIKGTILVCGSWGNAVAGWPVSAFATLLILAFGTGLLDGWSFEEELNRSGPRSGGEIPHPRPAQGELGWQSRRDALVGALAERYVRGELELEEYEAYVELLVRKPRAVPRERAGPRER